MTVIACVSDLIVSVPTADGGRCRIVDGMSLSVGVGESVSLVGESGAGKTVTGLALTRLLPEPARIDGGRVAVAGTDVLAASEPALDRMRGSVVGYVFQEPAAALDPLRTVAAHVAEGVRAGGGPASRRAVARRVAELLSEVGLEDVADMARAFPHQVSGGQRQRVLIAAALAGDPSLLVLDEPTSALDTVATTHFVALLERLQRRRRFATLFISHDLGLVSRVSTRVVVAHAGETVEEGTCADVLARPLHPYTQLLVDASVDWAGVGPAEAAGGRTAERARQRCRFAHACPKAVEACRKARPALHGADGGRRVRCFLAEAGPEGGDERE